MAAFRDLASRFADQNAQVLGVSVDPLPELVRFKQQLALPFPLLSDPGGATARAYGVLGEGGVAQRYTFVIDPSGAVRHVESGREAIDPSDLVGVCAPRDGGP